MRKYSAPKAYLDINKILIMIQEIQKNHEDSGKDMKKNEVTKSGEKISGANFFINSKDGRRNSYPLGTEFALYLKF